MSLERVQNKLFTAKTLAKAGFIQPVRPDKIARTLIALRRWGPTPAAGYTGSAIRYPDDLSIIDEGAVPGDLRLP